MKSELNVSSNLNLYGFNFHTKLHRKFCLFYPKVCSKLSVYMYIIYRVFQKNVNISENDYKFCKGAIHGILTAIYSCTCEQGTLVWANCWLLSIVSVIFWFSYISVVQTCKNGLIWSFVSKIMAIWKEDILFETPCIHKTIATYIWYILGWTHMHRKLCLYIFFHMNPKRTP
jgi:hypothetical protein